MNNITLEFYGRLRAQFSAQAPAYQTEHTTIADVYQQLCKVHKVPQANDIKPIINDEFANWQDEIKTGDVVGFLPPASGG